jgi:hypothetical protein
MQLWCVLGCLCSVLDRTLHTPLSAHSVCASEGRWVVVVPTGNVRLSRVLSVVVGVVDWHANMATPVARSVMQCTTRKTLAQGWQGGVYIWSLQRSLWPGCCGALDPGWTLSLQCVYISATSRC